jgi:hypothetical protein
MFGGSGSSWSIVCWENLKLKDYSGDVLVDIYHLYRPAGEVL